MEKLAAGTESDLPRGRPRAWRAVRVPPRTQQLLDLANRKGKAPGGYQTTLEDARLPFIFMNAVGLDSDVRTLLHEGGHAFHTLASPGRAAVGLPRKPARVLRGRLDDHGAARRPRLDPFYNPADADRSNRKLLEGIVLILPWIATVDAFQHWIYTPSRSHPRRAPRPPGETCSNGSAASSIGRATKRPATIPGIASFTFSCIRFYYIEYGIAQLGALQIWQRSPDRSRRGRGRLQESPGIGGPRPLPELFAAAGIRFDFGDRSSGRLMETIRTELEKLSP